MSKCRIAKNKLLIERQDSTEKSLPTIKLQKHIRPAPSTVLVEVGQQLGGDETKAISALRSLLRKKKKVVVVSDAGISVNAGSEFFLLLRPQRV